MLLYSDRLVIPFNLKKERYAVLCKRPTDGLAKRSKRLFARTLDRYVKKIEEQCLVRELCKGVEQEGKREQPIYYQCICQIFHFRK